MNTAIASPTSGPAVYPWDEARGRRLAKSAVARTLPMFSAWPGELDLLSIALQGIREAHRNFNPNHILPSGKRVRYSTFPYNVAKRRLLDLWRKRGREADHEFRYRQSWNPDYEPDNRDATDLEGLSLVDWLGQVYVRALRAYRPRVIRRGRKWFSVPQAVAAVLLMRRLKLSCRGAHDLLEQRPDLCEALRLTRLPSYGWFFRCKVIVRKLERRRRRKPVEPELPGEIRNRIRGVSDLIRRPNNRVDAERGSSLKSIGLE